MEYKYIILHFYFGLGEDMKKEKLHIKTFILLLLAGIFGGLTGLIIGYAETNYPGISEEELPSLLNLQTELFVLFAVFLIISSFLFRKNLKINKKTIILSFLFIIPVAVVSLCVFHDVMFVFPVVTGSLFLGICIIPIIIFQKRAKDSKKIKTLPFGFYSEKAFNATFFTAVLFIFILIAWITLSADYIVLNFIYQFIIYFVVFLTLSFVVIKINTNELMPILKSGNFALLDKFYNQLKNNERINPQTTYLIYLIRQYYLMFINLEEFKPEEITITSSSRLATKMRYYSTLGLYYVFTNKWDELHKLIETCPSILNKTKSDFALIEKALNTIEEIKNIDRKFPIKKKDIIATMVFAYIKMKYFEKRDNIEKAKEYAHFIINKKTCFEELNVRAKEVLEK